MAKYTRLTPEDVDNLVQLVIDLDPNSYNYAELNVFSETSVVDNREVVRDVWAKFFEHVGITYADAEAAIREYYSPQQTIGLANIAAIVRGWRSHVIAEAEISIAREMYKGE